MRECVCHSGYAAADCCEPYLNREKIPQTAEALMRSRYAAYVLGVVDYIKETSTGPALEGFDEAEAKGFIKEVKFLGLDILQTLRGGEADEDGVVEFVFHYSFKDKSYSQHEISHFVKKDGAWLFEDSEVNPKGETVKVVKVGRNDPCPCGSGKKHKKCCG